MKLIMCATSAAPLEPSSTVSPSAITSAPMMFYAERERRLWLPAPRGPSLSAPCPYLDRWCPPRVGPAKRPGIPRIGRSFRFDLGHSNLKSPTLRWWQAIHRGAVHVGEIDHLEEAHAPVS